MAVLDEVADRHETGVSAPTWVGRAGIVVVVVSLFGAIFPYFSNGLGLPLDGAPDGAMTAWRTALHLVPGVLGVVVGVAILAWARGLRRGVGTAHPDWVARAGMAVGAWFAVGPYIWGLVQPAHSVGTGGMAGTMTGMDMGWAVKVMMPMTSAVPGKMTTASCAFTMGVDHWAVGALIVLASTVALGAGAGRGFLAGLAGAEVAPTRLR